MKEVRMQKDWLKGAAVETIYLGGGTPSILNADELSRLFDTIIETFEVSELKECTLEANPDDLSISYLRALRHTPVNRLSVGIQSFCEEDLRYMNRAHTAQQSDYALKAAQDAGFTNLSIDLIYGTPGLSNESWKENNYKMAQLGIPHFSSYALTVEEGTALHHAIHKKNATPVDAAQSAEQALILIKEAESLGYEQYEISNFAKPGCYALHNTSYWKGTPYLGLGPSAHSFDGKNIRQWNVANNALYIQSINKGTIPYEKEILSDTQRLNEYIMTSLRTMWGLDLSHVEKVWGRDYSKKIQKDAQPYFESGSLKETDSKLILTSQGKLFADGIASTLFFS